MSQQPITTHLEAAPTKPLRFTVNGQQLVPNDFHVTEVKKVSIKSLDCGGGTSAWQELVIQLWSPRGDDTAQAMTAEKFAAILMKADALERDCKVVLGCRESRVARMSDVILHAAQVAVRKPDASQEKAATSNREHS